jgi:UPF0755 protein
VLVIAVAGAWMWYSIERPYQGFPSEGVFVALPHGASNRTVARLLKQHGVVRNEFAFKVYARQHPKRKLQAGEYFFSQALSGREVFWKIANGEVYQHPFTVREGETIFDIARELEAAQLMSASEFLAAAQNTDLIRGIAPRAKTLEGFLYPATYFLPRHTVPVELTAEMVKKFKEEWARIAPPEMQSDRSGLERGRPVASIVTLASLVERETPKAEERPLVASVFQNRLRKRIPLQCDPTVIYALEQTGQYRGTLSGRDLHLDSPYNTYARAGLPPGPIGNPGEASLRAAIDPADTQFLYFVANTQGGHFFSPTLAEHNRNVAKYRRLQAGLPAEPPPSPPAATSAKKNIKPRPSHRKQHRSVKRTQNKNRGSGR